MKIRQSLMSLRFKDEEQAKDIELMLTELSLMFATEGIKKTPEQALHDFLIMTCKAMHKQEEKPRIIMG